MIDYRPPTDTLKGLIDRILKSGYLTRQDHFQLTTAFLSDLSLTEADRSLINQIFDEVQLGQLKHID